MFDIIKIKEAYDLLPGIWCVVDAKSRYLYYNTAYAKLVGVADQPADYLLGKTVADMNCNAAACANLFWEADAKVIATKRMVQVLHSIQMANGQWTVLQIDKQPVLDEQGEVCAIIFHLIDQSANHMLDLALSVAEEKAKKSADSPGARLVNLSNQSLKVELKPKESECLFYLIRGYSYKEIASIQNITYRTVVDHIERLKSKFNVNTSNELITRALVAGHPGAVPQRYFEHQLSIILPA